MKFKTLPAILYDEHPSIQFYVSLYIILSIAALHLMLYTFRVVLMLSAIEQPEPDDSKRSVSRQGTDEISMSYLRANDRNRDGRPSAQQRRLSGQQQPPRMYKKRSMFQKISDTIEGLRHALSLLLPADGNGTVTRSLAATVQQLRYYSGSSAFFTRGLVLYLFWYHIAYAIFELAVLFIIALPITAVSVIVSISNPKPSGDGFFFSDSLFFGIVFEILLCMIRAAYFELCSEHIAFHTVRVFTVSTQLSTNTATKYFDPKIFRLHRNPIQLPRLSHAVWGCLYGLATFVSNAVPSWIAYGVATNKAGETATSTSPLLLRAFVCRVFLALCLDIPAMLMFVNSQARHIDPKEPTIVRYEFVPHKRRYYDIITSIYWRRVLRNMMQCLIVGCIVVATILLLGYIQFRNLTHADKFGSWIFSNYLDPQRSHAPFVALGTLNWWQNTVLITFNPWKWVIPYSEQFVRAQVFGIDG